MDTLRSYVLLTVTACAGVMAVLALMNWVEFESNDMAPADHSFSVRGTDLSRVRGDDYEQPADILKHGEPLCSCRVSFGDGYVVAGLALLVLAAAGAGVFLTGYDRSVAILISAASVGAFAIAGYNALGKWQAIGATGVDGAPILLHGTIRPELIALTALSGLTAVLGAVLWTLAAAWDEGYDGEDEEPEDIDDMMLERVNGWA
ncbi:MAG: hypothetical protein WD904_03910 [Dehalococcoidia bacterium]